MSAPPVRVIDHPSDKKQNNRRTGIDERSRGAERGAARKPCILDENAFTRSAACVVGSIVNRWPA